MCKKILLLIVLAAFLSAGCASAPSKKEGAKKKVETYTGDLNGDGLKETVEVEDKLDSCGEYEVSIYRQQKRKEKETIDKFSIPGKLRKFELVELNADGQTQISVTFDGKDDNSSIVVYQLLSGKLSKMFEASSPYGILTDYTFGFARIKIGKPPRGGEESPNRMPDWESWIWLKDKDTFIRE
jgi:hypothetical protein